MIADRYLLKTMLAPWVLGVGASVTILLGDVFYASAELIARGAMPAPLVLRVLLYKLPAVFVVTLPVATLLGTLLGLGRMARDQEILAMRLAGLSLARIMLPALAFGLAAGAATFAIDEGVAPWANHRADTLVRRAAQGGDLAQIREQVFFHGPGNRVIYADKVDDGRHLLWNAMIFEFGGAVPRLITARTATWSASAWSLYDGVIREFDSNGFTRDEARFATMDVPTGAGEETLFTGQRTPEEMTARELHRYVTLFRASSAGAAMALEYYRKFAVPFANVAFALLAAVLGLRATQGDQFVGVGLSIGLLFVYYAAAALARAFAGIGTISPLAGAWGPNVLFVAGALALVVRGDGWWRRLFAPAPRLRARAS